MSANLSQIAAVILAGGRGTRIQHLLPDLPKPMAPVAGKPFLEWVIRYLAGQGICRAILSTGHLAEVVEAHFRSHPVQQVRISCVAEPEPLGTAGGFLHAVRASQESPAAWLVLNGDSLALFDFSLAAKLLIDESVAGVVVGVEMADASRYGTLVQDSTGKLLRFEEKRRGSGVINAGIYLLRGALLDRFPRQSTLSFERDVFPTLTRKGACLKVHTVNAPFLDIGTPETLPQAETFIRRHQQEFLGL